jgi:hypothetical protein
MAAQVAGLAGRRWAVNPYLSVVLGVSASVLLCALLWFVRRFLCRMRPGAPVVRPPCCAPAPRPCAGRCRSPRERCGARMSDAWPVEEAANIICVQSRAKLVRHRPTTGYARLA